MDDKVLFVILYCNMTGRKTYPEEASCLYVDNLYEDWCEQFYRGTVYEYNSPTFNEIKTSVIGFLFDRLDLNSDWRGVYAKYLG